MTTQQEGRGADRPVSLKDWGDQELGAFAEIERMPLGMAESGLAEYQTLEVLDALWEEMERVRARARPEERRKAA